MGLMGTNICPGNWFASKSAFRTEYVLLCMLYFYDRSLGLLGRPTRAFNRTHYLTPAIAVHYLGTRAYSKNMARYINPSISPL